MQLATEAPLRQPRSRSDFRASVEKAASRAFNIAALDDATFLAIPGERLNLDWLELAGEGAPTYDLLAPMLTSTRDGYGRFIGVDDDKGVIERCRARNLSHAVWVHGRLQHKLSDDPTMFANVGVLNYDSFAGWHSDAILKETAPLVAFAAEQYKSCGEFVLIVNAVTRNQPRAAVMRRVQKLYAPLLAPLERKVEVADIFEYPSEYGNDRMVNVRVKLGFKLESE